MMNWPTAFVIAFAICAGAFLYNKPSDAAFGGSDRYWLAVNFDFDQWVQFDGNKQRLCSWRGKKSSCLRHSMQALENRLMTAIDTSSAVFKDTIMPRITRAKPLYFSKQIHPTGAQLCQTKIIKK